MSGENQTVEKKSLRLVLGKRTDFEEIAKECVGMANTRGGHIYIGIEDEEDLPPAEQVIPDNLIGEIHKREMV